jgi:hypothetical protein
VYNSHLESRGDETLRLAQLQEAILDDLFARCALYESQETLSGTLTSVGETVVVMDDKKLVRFMNPVAESLSGGMWWKLSAGRSTTSCT